MKLEYCEYCGKRHHHGSMPQLIHQTLMKAEYVRGQPLYYGHWGPSPDDLIICLRCGCDDMARLRKSNTFVCRNCRMEHDYDGAMIGEAKVEQFKKVEVVQEVET